MRLSEQAIFFRQLATMTGAGIPIVHSLSSIKNNTKNQNTRYLLEQMIAWQVKGENFTAIAARMKAFPPFILGMLKAGETSGQLDVRMHDIAAFLERTDQYRKQLIGKLLYPALVINASFLFLPIQHIITGSLQEYFLTVFLSFIKFYSCIAFLFLLRYFILKQEGTAIVWGNIILKLPIIGSIIKSMAIQRFLIVYGSLIDAALPLRDALTTASSSMGNAHLAKKIQHVLRLVNSGLQPALAIAQVKLLPYTAIELLKTGETTGNTGEMAKQAAKYMEIETKTNIDRLTAAIPAIVILIIGVYVGYNLYSNYSGYINQIQNITP